MIVPSHTVGLGRHAGLGVTPREVLDAIARGFPGEEVVYTTIVDLARGRVAPEDLPRRFVREIRVRTTVSDPAVIRIGQTASTDVVTGGGAAPVVRRAANLAEQALAYIKPTVDVVTPFGNLTFAPYGEATTRRAMTPLVVGSVVIVGFAVIGVIATILWTSRRVGGRRRAA